ncbi:serum response factor homolog A [Drosophila gunungcola]|uniref:Uncharacterized protein n=1 Tax=Drosophila gunungcola TaxID=103775 RepID=A0A9P9YG49_9MUSC|nr:serum response factor homolog A [Drosophila gunungcola]KAI8036075.1 hypothetical protein M5D96_011169 [Drosophila gunungcola]
MKLPAVVILLALGLLAVQAAPEKKLTQKTHQVEEKEVASGAAGAAGAKDPSSGRLFLKKFLTFKNLFSSSNQPVIPIIITGAGTGTGTTTNTGTGTSPTVTVTSTGTIPSATGTITTSPTTSPTPVRAFGPTIVKGARYGSDDQDEDQDQDGEKEQDLDQEQEQEQEAQLPAQAYPAELMDEQALQAALAAGAQEYEVVTEQEVQGTAGSASLAGTESKATQSNHISLRRKGARRGQVISVRIPPRYRRYFKNGQKVMLNTGSRPATKRRVVRKRVPAKKINRNNNRNGNINRRRNGNNNKKNRRNNRNKNRRNRITAV